MARLLVVELDALGDFGDDRCRTGAGAAAHAGGDEEHLGVVGDGVADFVGFLESGLTGALGFVAGTKSVTQRNFVGDGRGVEGLHVGVADDEVDSLDTLTEHVVDCVAAATADTNDFDVGRLAFGRVKIDIRGSEREIYYFFHVLVYFYLTE